MMFRKLLALVLMVVVVHALLAATGGRVIAAAVVLWLLEGYVVVRAFPAIRSDLARLPGFSLRGWRSRRTARF
jgi:uncharacterized membrane protein